jgi:hypothetical protein
VKIKKKQEDVQLMILEQVQIIHAINTVAFSMDAKRNEMMEAI